jgi:hypothetical protein
LVYLLLVKRHGRTPDVVVNRRVATGYAAVLSPAQS